MAKRKMTPTPAENIAKQIMETYKPQSAQEIQDVVKQIFAPIFEAALQGEMDNHLGYANHERSEQDSSNEASSEEVSSKPNPEYVTRGSYTLDASYSNLLLVNAENPLPEDYDYTGNLTEINQKYINGSLRQIDKNVYPYMQAMIEAAWADGVKLYVWSPYRSYDTQNMLFQKQVQRCINNGTPQSEAEAEAATVVARPGTSEHHTGLAADFNMASDDFENTAMYEWMQKHAAEYGFLMRYPADKTDITGVIYESWHYRFVGINAAKEMNSLGMCLEEYVKYKNKR